MKHISSFLIIFLVYAIWFPACTRAQKASSPIASGPSESPSAVPHTASSWINVISYGAKADGVADDTAAINSAMTACTSRAVPNNGCILYFPAGVYITTGITLRSYVNMKGDGRGTSVIQLRPHTASDVLTVPIDTFNFSIYGLTLDGNSARGGTGNCLSVAPTSTRPAEWNTANKRRAPVNAQKWGHVEEVMFSHCSVDGIHIKAFNYMLFFDNTASMASIPKERTAVSRTSRSNATGQLAFMSTARTIVSPRVR